MKSKLIFNLMVWLIGCIFVCKVNAIYSDNPYRIKKVVIDAGHGGKDPGCPSASKKNQEKHVALGIALKLGKLIEDSFKEVEVIYTRKTDVFIELKDRAEIANKHKADLFICIHANSNPNKIAGAETYVMGLHKTAASIEVAKRENAVILMEENYEKKYEGFDPNSPEANIVFSLYQNAYLDQSLNFASKIQNNFVQIAKRQDRGVKQAGFWVLFKVAMPSVLIETGFLTTLDEEIFLTSEKGQNLMAQSLFTAFKEYKNEMEGVKTRLESPKNDIIVDNAKPPLEEKKTEITTKVENNTSTNNQLIFKVQFAISNREMNFNNLSEAELKKLSKEKIENNNYKYLLGDYDSLGDAINAQNNLRSKGYKDAFTVPYQDGKRISMDEARAILKQKQ